jgi:hypothetical protein
MTQNTNGGGLLGGLSQQGGFKFGMQRQAPPGGTGQGYFNQPGLRMLPQGSPYPGPAAAPTPGGNGKWPGKGTGGGEGQPGQDGKPSWWPDNIPFPGELQGNNMGGNYAPWPMMNQGQWHSPTGQQGQSGWLAQLMQQKQYGPYGQ